MQYEDGGAADQAVQSGEAILGSGAVLTLADCGRVQPSRRNTSSSRDAADRAPAFLVLERAWSLEGGTLVDFKVEFGFDAKGNLLLADVIDNGLVAGAGERRLYRQAGLSATAARTTRWRRNTSRWRRPPRISACRGSASSCGAARRPTRPRRFPQALGELKDLMTVVTCSIHKEPMAGAGILNR
jgi:phosphoribosylaminoimidazole carboxylase/phosphoribosylaminoimidazole-succinocarboxamide synthase